MYKGFTVVKKIVRRGYPTNSRGYKLAHNYANKVEKKHDPKEYAAMKKVDTKLPKNELAGKHTKAGKILISSKVPKKYRAEIARFHEYPEHLKMRAQLQKRKGR